MTSVVTPQASDVAFSQVDAGKVEITGVAAQQHASKRLSILLAAVIISLGVLLCFVLMNAMCCSA